MEEKLEKGYVIDMNGDEQYEDDCVTLADGDIVYGAFDKITVGETDEYVLAYIGK